jgi:uncharacterized low-complexity protein
MTKKTLVKPLSVAIGAAFVGSLAGANVASAADNPFGMTTLSSGYMVSDAHEGKCGGEKAAEAKCGGEKKSAEGKCGGEKKAKEGKCGEGKCGAKMMEHEGKCGGEKKPAEGKCGGNK